MKRLRTILVGLGGVALVGVVSLVIGGFAYQELSEAGHRKAFPPPGELVDVDRRLMYIHCMGSGSPTVVFERGLTGCAAGIGPVHRAVAETTRSCAYDRDGLGYSAPTDHAQPASESAAQLHGLLAGAGISAPLVLVGASRGACLRVPSTTRFRTRS
ncbi:MAG: hypothetical protein ACJATT_004775 [Myxococcota bacterium]|jgi:hypothetical protein